MTESKKPAIVVDGIETTGILVIGCKDPSYNGIYDVVYDETGKPCLKRAEIELKEEATSND
jgi:hypothetical protein